MNTHSYPGHNPNSGHESAGAAGNDAGGTYHRRADSLAQSVERMKGRAGVTKLRHMLYEARHTALAAELQGRG